MTLLVEITLVAAAAAGVAVSLAQLPKTLSDRWRSDDRSSRRRDLRSCSPPNGWSARLGRWRSRSTRTCARCSSKSPLDGSPVAAWRSSECQESVGQELLGDQLWEIVRPNRPFPGGQIRSRRLAARPQRYGRRPRATVSGSLSPRVPGQLALAGAALVAGLALGPAGARSCSPCRFCCSSALVWSSPRSREVAAELELERLRLLEGEDVRARPRSAMRAIGGRARAWPDCGPDISRSIRPAP